MPTPQKYPTQDNAHRHQSQHFPPRSIPQNRSPIAIADQTGSGCARICDTLRIEERRERREKSFEELATVELFLTKIVGHTPTFELWRKLDGTDELTDAEFAREVQVDPATIGRWLKSFRIHLREIAQVHPEWIANLPERYRRIILASFRDNPDVDG